MRLDDSNDVTMEEEDQEALDGDELSLIADTEMAGERLDRILTARLKDASRTEVQRWMDEGHVFVSGKTIKSNYKLREGDVIAFRRPLAIPASLTPESIPLDVVFEDRDVIVINKPRGMVVHPSHGHATGTLVHGLLAHCADLSGIGGELRPGIVHRIDKDTSGLLMAAKNDVAHRDLAEQLKQHTVKRTYITLVHGVVEHHLGTVDAPIGRDHTDRQAMAVEPQTGKHAVTHFTVVERFREYTLLALQLETGRTHQIRVHLAYIGYPVVGDPKYGRRNTLPISGQALHAQTLGFHHPRTKEWLEFTAPIPDDMQSLIDNLRQYIY